MVRRVHKNFLILFFRNEDVVCCDRRVSIHPDIRDKKKGDLSISWIDKFRCQGQLYLLGHTCDDAIKLRWLEALGSQENFYREIKRE